MEKGDIIKVKIRFGGYVIGVIDSITIDVIKFEMYCYNNFLRPYSGFTQKYEMLDITPEEIDFFKNQLLSKGYSYDDETKTIIHEL